MTRTMSAEAKKRKKARKKANLRARKGSKTIALDRTQVIARGDVNVEVTFADGRTGYAKLDLELRATKREEEWDGLEQWLFNPGITFLWVRKCYSLFSLEELAQATHIQYLQNYYMFSPLRTIVNSTGALHGVECVFWKQEQLHDVELIDFFEEIEDGVGVDADELHEFPDRLYLYW